MKLDVFQKVVDDLAVFDKPIKVLRLYKDGEPFLNKRLAGMVAYARKSGHVDYIATTTNGTFLSPERVGPVLDAGIDKINISVDGMTEETYLRFTGFKFDFAKFVENVKWIYANKGNCEIVVKIPSELITEAQRQQFFDTFGDHCDRIFVENFAPCWPKFDIEAHTGVKIRKGIYQQDIGETDTYPYIFYGYSVNADGLVSSCFFDWGRKLVIGDVRTQSMKEIWNSTAMNALRLQHLEGHRRQTQPLPAGQYRRASPDAAGKVQDARRRRSRRRAARWAKSQVHGRGGGMKILHVAPHLGGGVGKAHAAISAALPDVAEQTFVLLEDPRDRRYLEMIDATGGRVVVAADLDQVASLARAADIVQFEFWNHPRLFECLARCAFPAMRSVFWSHISGLFRRLIQPGLMAEAGRFVFSSEASLSIPWMPPRAEPPNQESPSSIAASASRTRQDARRGAADRPSLLTSAPSIS